MFPLEKHPYSKEYITGVWPPLSWSVERVGTGSAQHILPRNNSMKSRSQNLPSSYFQVTRIVGKEVGEEAFLHGVGEQRT